MTELYVTNDCVNKIFNSRRVILNIGGIKHDVRWKTLEKLPNSRLGKIRFARNLHEIQGLCDEVNVQANELYFDKSYKSFHSIIEYYRSDKLHLAQNVCIISFHNDLKYWGIEEIFMDQCCNLKYHETKEEVQKEMLQVKEFEKEEKVEDEFESVKCCPTSRKIVWDIMENPQTSRLAKVIKSF